MEENPLEGVVDGAVDGMALVSSDLKKSTAIEVTKSYAKAMVAAATAVPVYVALSGTPSISQERVREPENQPHVPSQSHSPLLQEPEIVIVSAVSGDFSKPLTGELIIGSQGQMETDQEG